MTRPRLSRERMDALRRQAALENTARDLDRIERRIAEAGALARLALASTRDPQPDARTLLAEFERRLAALETGGYPAPPAMKS